MCRLLQVRLWGDGLDLLGGLKGSTRLSRLDTIMVAMRAAAEATGMTVFAENIRRVGSGEILLNLVM